MPRGDRSDDIMKAAEALFTSRRFHQVTLDDVAREARIGKGTIYRYFTDKDDLFFQTVTAGFDELCETIHRRVSDEAPFDRQLLSACQATIGFFERRRHLFRMMQSEEARIQFCTGALKDRWLAQRQKLVAAFAAILCRGVAEGRVRDDLPPEMMASLLLGMLRTRARELRDYPEALQRPEVILDLFCRGANAAGVATPSAIEES